MIKSLYILSVILVFVSCKAQTPKEKTYAARNDIRFGKRFFSIFINEDGTAYVIKGIGSNYMDSLKIESSDTSEVFKLDSSNVYFEQLKKIKNDSIMDPSIPGGPRTEIYYHQQKVYDSYYGGEKFWDMFRPIMEQLPKGFSPFRVNEKPFD